MQQWTYIKMPAMALGAAYSAMVAQKIGAGRRDREITITFLKADYIGHNERQALEWQLRHPSGGISEKRPGKDAGLWRERSIFADERRPAAELPD